MTYSGFVLAKVPVKSPRILILQKILDESILKKYVLFDFENRSTGDLTDISASSTTLRGTPSSDALIRG